MQNFIIVAEEGYTLSPNDKNCGISVDNLRVLGFARGGRLFRGNGFTYSNGLSDADFEPIPLK